jgi:hypothetical protein
VDGHSSDPVAQAPSWVPDLCSVDLRRLAMLPDAALDEARQSLLGKFDRPFATVAGSEGS